MGLLAFCGQARVLYNFFLFRGFDRTALPPPPPRPAHTDTRRSLRPFEFYLIDTHLFQTQKMNFSFWLCDDTWYGTFLFAGEREIS